jgi:DNA-binding response OmpR family regulator
MPQQILVVEDDTGIRDVLCLALEDEGFVAAPAEDGAAAMAWLDAHSPALTLLDMNLPRVGGSQVARRLQMEHGGDVPIVVVTADDWAAQKAHEVGAVAYFRKPFDLNQLLSTIQRILRGRRR